MKNRIEIRINVEVIHQTILSEVTKHADKTVIRFVLDNLYEKVSTLNYSIDEIR